MNTAFIYPSTPSFRAECSIPSFDLGFGSEDHNIDEAILCAPIDVEGLETSLLSKYSDNLVSNVELERIFDSLDVAEGTEHIPAPILAQGAQTPAGPATSDAFLPRDLAFQEALNAGGENPSVNVDKWALNRLRKFREHINADLSIELVDMDPPAASILLCEFFERARKENTELYPPASLMSLLRAFNRVFRKAQEARVLRTGVDEHVFSMKQSPLFRRVCVACVLAMTRSKEAGLGVKRKKASIVSLKDEKSVLDSSFMAKTNSRGLLRRTAHYCLFRFGIRGGNELRSLKAMDFVVGSDDAGRFVQYDERVSKNYRVTLERFQTEHFRPAVKCHEPDCVETFEMYLSRRPDRIDELFLAPIDNPRTRTWYARVVVGARQLSNIVKQSFQEAGIVDDGSSSSVSNKSGRATLITRMAESGVPPKVGMLITGHKSEGAYGRYDQSAETRVRAAQRCAEGNSVYADALQEENRNMKVVLIEGKENEKEPCKRMKRACGAVPDSGQIVTKDGTVALPVRIEPVAECEEWAANYDWRSDLKIYDKGKAQIVNNPVSALFGNLTNCTLNVSFAGPVNFAGQGHE